MNELGKVFADIDISLDGFIAGEDVSGKEPLGKDGDKLIWYGDDINDECTDLLHTYEKVDAQILEKSAVREGAVIMGRKTFEVSVHEWGENPPIHKPCFILTHRPTQTILKEGGTTFTFVTDLHDVVSQALRAAEGRDVGVMGGASIIRQFLSAGLLDELHLHLIPVFLGNGIRLFDNINSRSFSLEKISVQDGSKATHLLYKVTKK